jgi:hypothetical protein
LQREYLALIEHQLRIAAIAKESGSIKSNNVRHKGL